MADTSTIPPDDPLRKLTVADPDGPGVRHVAVVGDTYSILVSGTDTAGRYCLIDMIVPDGGGPPPHRHDFEEMFTLLEGELEFTFRGEKKTVRAGSTVNIPAKSAACVQERLWPRRAHALPVHAGGQEEFFMAIGDPLESRTSPRPRRDKAQMEERIKKAKALAPQYRTELLIP